MEKGENSVNNQGENDVIKSSPETNQKNNIETPNSPLSSVRMEDKPQSLGEEENIQNEEEEVPQPDQNQPDDDKKKEETEEDSDEMDGKKKDETDPSNQDGSGKRPLPITGNPLLLDILLMVDPLNLGRSLPSQNKEDEEDEEDDKEKSNSSQKEEEDRKDEASQELLSESMSKAMLDLMESKTYDDFLLFQTLLSPDIQNLRPKKSEHPPNGDDNHSESKEEKETEKVDVNEVLIQKVFEVIDLNKRIVIILSFLR